MPPLAVLRPLRQISPVLCRTKVQITSGRGISKSCKGPEPRAEPKCVPAQQPACRPRPPDVGHRGKRVVCCAPPRGDRPLCTPPAPVPPLSCSNHKTTSRATGCMKSVKFAPITDNKCGDGQDRVARRLSTARAIRRADYESEAAQRRPAAVLNVAPYSLGSDRDCTQATDGIEYALPCSDAEPPRCGPGRTPPPPRCVPLPPDDACRISGGTHVDPCANQPRIFVEIDRSSKHTSNVQSTADASKATSNATSGSNQQKVSTTRSLTSRIMDGLGRSCRTGNDRVGGDSCHDRRLHTSTAVMAESCSQPTTKPEAPKTKGGSKGLEAMLQERKALAEAGRGRVAMQCAEGKARNKSRGPPTGSLELPVPSGADRVKVRVALEGASASESAKPLSSQAPTLTDGCKDFISDVEKKDSWLSIKTIKKRLAGYQSSDSSGNKKNKDGACTPKPSTPKKVPGCAAPMPSQPSKPSSTTGPQKPSQPPKRKQSPPCNTEKTPSKTDTKKCSAALPLLCNTIPI